jgi:hypothetical protein
MNSVLSVPVFSAEKKLRKTKPSKARKAPLSF